MSNHVKIATIGPRPLELSVEANPQNVVNQMIDHWRKEFTQVLPDDPDLIVVPEICDCPRDWPFAGQLEHYQIRKNQVRDFFAQIAKDHNCYIVYAAIRETEDACWYNSTVVLDRNGNIAGTYNKNHLVVEEEAKAKDCNSVGQRV